MKLVSTAVSTFRYFSTSIRATKSSKQISLKNEMNLAKKPKTVRLKWTDEQVQVLDAVSSGKSVFITGSAGTGKTALLEAVIKRLKKLHGSTKVYVTASTGIAACALNGQTLHSFAGVGLSEGSIEALLAKVISNRRAYKRWNKAKALVIDEISMISAELFDIIEKIARGVREVEDGLEGKWGGIQLVVTGDFFQLPPIIDKSKSSEKIYAFEAESWNSTFDYQIELTKIFRQSEAEFVKVLQNIRKGRSDLHALSLLEKCFCEKEPDSSIVKLYPLCKDVDRVNQKQIQNLDTCIHIYRALDSGEEPYKRQLMRGIAPDEIGIAKGARVVLCKNLYPQLKLVNGATGTVVSFRGPGNGIVPMICEDKVVPVVKFDSGAEIEISPQTWNVMEGDKVVATRKQLPLILAWAMSVHKCQGMTLDSLYTDLSKAFGFGMVYVALSRVRNLDGLHLSGFNPSKIKAHPKVLKYYQNFSSKQDKQSGEEEKNFCEDKGSCSK